MSNAKLGGSHIDSFSINGVRYEHLIFCSEDDRIELHHRFPEDGQGALLKFDANCGVWTPDGKRYGRLRLWGSNDEWEFIFADETKFFPTHKDLLKLEVEVSKQYLLSQVKP